MSGIERAPDRTSAGTSAGAAAGSAGRAVDRAAERERMHAGERALARHAEAHSAESGGSAGQGRDAYGCVDWFDYCPLPRTDPPVCRRR